MSARVKMGRFQNAGTHTPPSRPVSRSLRRKSMVYNHASAQNVDEEVGEERRAKYGEYGEYGNPATPDGSRRPRTRMMMNGRPYSSNARLMFALLLSRRNDEK